MRILPQYDPEATGKLDYTELMRRLLDADGFAMYSAGAARKQAGVINITPGPARV